MANPLSNAQLQILMVEDDVIDKELIEDELRRAEINFTARRVETRDDFLKELKNVSPDVILSDYSLPHFSGLEALQLVKERMPSTPFILVTGSLTEETAVECMKAGASDYVIKEHLVRLGSAVRGALERKIAMEEKEWAQAEFRKIAADLARSNQELERFAYVASHDLQEPLRMVSNFVQLLARRYQGRLDADADDFIRFVVDGVKRMKNLIDGLLEYSRAGREGEQLVPTDCGEALNQALENLRVTIQESNASITRDPLPTVLSESVQLTELFQNLIGNAMKFHNHQCPRVHIGVQCHGGEWIFSVRDNGIGIDPKYTERIFDVFQRLHSAHKYPGTGIGLAICKKIVQRHGGRIWVESQPGQGATFYFTIPLFEREPTWKKTS